MTWIKAFFAILACVAVAACSSQPGSKRETSLPADIAEALSWLPKTSETVIVFNSPFTFHYKASDDEIGAMEACSRLNLIGVPYTRAFLEGVSANWVVSGTRNYRPAGGLGLCPFEGCKVISLSTNDIDKVIKRVDEESSERINLRGHEVRIWREKLESNEWSYYITSYKDNLLISTDKKYLEEVLALTASPNPTPAHATMSLWNQIDSRAAFWAVRSFTKRSNELRYGMNMDDKGLRGYAIQIDREGKQLTITQSSESKKGKTIARELWGNLMTPNESSAEFEDTAGYLRITFGPDKEDWGTIALYLFAAVGHCIFL